MGTYGSPSALREWYGRHRADILLTIIILLVTGPVMQTYMAKQASRYTLTAAIRDEHSVAPTPRSAQGKRAKEYAIGKPVR